MALRHDGDDLPADQDHALWLTALAMGLSSMLMAMQGNVSSVDFALFVAHVTINVYFMLSGLFKMQVYSALISIFADMVRIVWLMGGATHAQLGWVSAWDSFAWVRAALMIGFF
jgi:hypothetical protein